MIDIKGGGLYDLLPASMKSAETEALSYALRRGLNLLLSLADGTRAGAAIEDLPEGALDALAVELRAPYYAQTMSIETKRAVVSRSLRWNMTAGTPAAVRELIEAVFGGGRGTEWPQFEEGERTPGTFDVETGAQLTPDIVDRFTGILERVKNVRSHIRRVLISRRVDMPERVVAAAVSEPHRSALMHVARAYDLKALAGAAALAESIPKAVIDNQVPPRSAQLSGGIYYVAAAYSYRSAKVPIKEA